MINLEEILMVNLTGVVILVVLMLLRVENRAAKHLGDYLFDAMEYLTLFALVAETLSFLLDGMAGPVVLVLQYVINGGLFLSSCAVGLVWVLFVDYQIYHSLKRLKKRFFQFLPLFALIAGMVVCDLFGAGLIFSVTDDNVYVRGNWVMLPYLVLFFYYGFSIVLAVRAVRHDGHVQFFPIHYFVTPALLGTILQGLCYGLAAGWFSLSLALMFIRMQLLNQRAFVDELSGLYNRQYYHHFLGKMKNSRKWKSVAGILLDVNHFKSINDQFGHTMGDDAIRSMGMVLSQVSTERSTAFRLAGDEFIILTGGAQEAETEALIAGIEQKLEAFNASAGKPYLLSVAMGYTICDTAGLDYDEFLHGMDRKMYQAKDRYYSQAGKDRRRKPEQNR